MQAVSKTSGILLAKSGGERGEAGGAGGGARDRPEPVAQASEVDRGRGGHVLQVGPGQPAVTAAAQPEGAHALREGALDPGPPVSGKGTTMLIKSMYPETLSGVFA